MSRIRQTLEQEAGKQLPQGTGVHAGQEKKMPAKEKKGNPRHK